MISVVLCGVGGFGQTYAKALLAGAKEHDIQWVGAVEPFPDRVWCKDEIDAAGVPWYGSLEAFYREQAADLCVIATPIGLHAPQSIFALNQGSHVLCEKPAAALPRDLDAMAAARNAAGKILAIGFQQSYSQAVLRIKQDILDGLYGKPLRLRTRALWPRDHAYFSRGSGWAGKVKDASGNWALDSIANNAAAHYLHNMLYVLGQPGCAALPDTMQAVLARANPIEMYDTAFLRMELGGAVLSFIGTHAGADNEGIHSRYEFEHGDVVFVRNTQGPSRWVGTLNDGRTIEYGDPAGDPALLWKIVAHLRGQGSAVLPCDIVTAMPHNRAMIAALLSAEIKTMPGAVDDGTRFFISGLDEQCRICDQEQRLPTQSDAPWAEPGKTVQLDDPRIGTYGT